jgi:hypothetical protein
LRWLDVGVILAVGAALMFGVASATATGGLTWGAPSLVDHHAPYGDVNSINGISCPSASFCAGVDSDGNAILSANPTMGASDWNAILVDQPSVPQGTGGYFTSISCSTASICVAVDSGGNAYYTSDPTGGASDWTANDMDGSNDLTSVSCVPGGTFCAAVDSAGNILTNNASGSGSWSTATSTSEDLDGISCPSTSLCVAVSTITLPMSASQGDVYYSTTPTTGGWTHQTAADTHSFEAISCPSASLCVAADVDGNILYATSFSSTPTWTSVQADPSSPPSGFGLSGISCVTSGSTTCVAVDDVGNVIESANPTVTADWVVESNVDSNSFEAVACATAALCVASDNSGNVYSSTTPATQSSWAAALVDASTAIYGASCPTSGLCVAVDSKGNVLTQTSPPSGAWTITNLDSNSLAAVSCASSGLCVAVDNDGNAWISTDPTGGSGDWTEKQIDSTNVLTSVSCSSTTLCVAVDEDGNAVTSTNPTLGGSSTWVVSSIDPLHTHLAGVSCAAGTTFCATVDFDGNVLTTSNSGSSWSSPVSINNTHALTSITCESATECVTTDATGDILSSSTPTTSPWATDTNADGTNYLLDVTCATASLCVASDEDGNVLTSTTPLTGGWSSSSIDGSTYLFAVACYETTFCVAGDRLGNVVAGVGTTATDPGAPTITTVSPGNGQVTVDFSPPTSDGGSTITSYTATSSGGQHMSGTGSPIVVSGLTNGTSYTFTVTATNGVGTGAASAPSNAVTPSSGITVPGAPTGVTATPGNGEATVMFSAPVSNGGSAILHYTVTSSPATTPVVGSGSPIVVTGLTNGTSYTFTVTATNGAGTGAASTASNAVTPTASSGGGGGGGGGGGSASLALSITPASQTVASGGTASWTVSVTNTGGNYVGDVAVSDAGVPNCAQNSGQSSGLYSMAPNVSVTYSCSSSGVTSAFTNTVNVSGVDPAGNSVTASAAAAVAVNAPVPVPVPTKPLPVSPGPVSIASLNISGIEQVLLKLKKPVIRFTIKVSKTTKITVVLLNTKGLKLNTWTVRESVGTHKLEFLVPLKARKVGHETVHILVTGNAKPKSFSISLAL